MNKTQVLALGVGITLAGGAIIAGEPLDWIVTGYIWVAWGIITIINVLIATNMKWW